MKFSALTVRTVSRMVSGTPVFGPKRDRADVGDRQEEERQLDAEQHHHAGGGDLAGQLGQRVQAPLVVEHAEQADQPAGDQHGVGLRVVERPLQRREAGGHEDARRPPPGTWPRRRPAGSG